MSFDLPPLPYAKHALEPYMSRETLEYHYEKHHRGYLTNLEKAVAGTPLAERPLEEILRTTNGALFNNAAQVWNHTFFWICMQPKGGGEPAGEVGARLRDAFGSYDEFTRAFVDTGLSHFGSGYLWLVLDRQRSFRLLTTPNAGNPLTEGHTPLLTCDLWEHAYYLDYRNRRAEYLDAFVRHLIDWDRVEASLEATE